MSANNINIDVQYREYREYRAMGSHPAKAEVSDSLKATP